MNYLWYARVKIFTDAIGRNKYCYPVLSGFSSRVCIDDECAWMRQILLRKLIVGEDSSEVLSREAVSIQNIAYLLGLHDLHLTRVVKNDIAGLVYFQNVIKFCINNNVDCLR